MSVKTENNKGGLVRFAEAYTIGAFSNVLKDIVAITEEVFYPPIKEFLKTVLAQRLPYDMYFLRLNVDLCLLWSLYKGHCLLIISLL